MPCDSIQDINQTLSSFELFINTYENFDKFLEEPSTEDIKNCFKLAHFIERTALHFESKDIIDRWMVLLHKRFENEGRNFSCYNAEFLKIACDQILGKFFEQQLADINVIDVCVRIYTSLLPKSRFQTFCQICW
ncbi:hypothetical protein HHI36_011188 [Cryptolaemus montrouzieri]|uniref:Uncharacterized protein n=1 Tax=Cryptolaemus montrouzieri TaxID=559131 RepID=A0ABD2MKW7_9CUCU